MGFIIILKNMLVTRTLQIAVQWRRMKQAHYVLDYTISRRNSFLENSRRFAQFPPRFTQENFHNSEGDVLKGAYLSSWPSLLCSPCPCRRGKPPTVHHSSQQTPKHQKQEQESVLLVAQAGGQQEQRLRSEDVEVEGQSFDGQIECV